MRIVGEYKGDKIILKKYPSYLEMDKDLSSFKSKKEMMKRLSFEKDIDDIYIEDNNGNKKELDFNFDLLRQVIPFYEKRRGDEFVRWIFYSACNSHDRGTNKQKLYTYFSDRLSAFTKNDKKFNPDSINNNEGKRIYSLIVSIMNGISIYKDPSVFKQLGSRDIIPDLENYNRKNGKYDYSYMRKMLIDLSKYNYKLKESGLEPEKIDQDKQDQIPRVFRDSIKSYFVTKKQITLDELTKEDVRIDSTFDENGEKVDEILFHQEEIEKKILRG